MKLTKYILIGFVLLVGCKKEQLYNSCGFYNLCDSVFYCSYEINGETYYEKQIFNFSHHSYYDVDSVSEKQVGVQVMNVLNFENNASIVLAPKFVLNEVNYSNGYNNLFVDTLAYWLINIEKSVFLDRIIDTMRPIEKFFIYKYVDTYDEWEGEKVDSISYPFFTNGFNFDVQYNGYEWNSLRSSNDDQIAYKKANMSSFLVVKKITPYNKNIHIVEGEFQCMVYRYEYIYNTNISGSDEDGVYAVETLPVSNGKFKIFLFVPDVDYYYNDYTADQFE